MSKVIPVNEPEIGEDELRNVVDCVRSGWISSDGRYLTEFEQQWAHRCGMRFGVAVSNGTAALELAVRVLDLSPGDEVIVPSFTIISCAQAVTLNGGKLALVDVDPETFCIDVEQARSLIGPRTKAIMPVHMYGHPAEMDSIRALADQHGLRIIEDAAQTHGAAYRGRPCGGLGDLSCFSFYANKIITTGEGGMVLTSSEELATRLRSYRNLCHAPERRFLHHELGHNYRLTNVQAAIGLAQISKLDAKVASKRRIAAAYTARLAKHAGLQLPVERPGCFSVYWMYGVVLDEKLGVDAAEMARRLSARGIQTRPFFVGMHEQPALREHIAQKTACPVTERIARQGFYLPSGLTLTGEEIDRVCEAVDGELRAIGAA